LIFAGKFCGDGGGGGKIRGPTISYFMPSGGGQNQSKKFFRKRKTHFTPSGQITRRKLAKKLQSVGGTKNSGPFGLAKTWVSEGFYPGGPQPGGFWKKNPSGELT